MSRNLAPVLALLALTGCALRGSVNVDPVAVSSEKPGNVALYVAVSQHGAGVVGLKSQDFKVYENGALLENAQIQLTLLPTNPLTSRRAAVLVDMSKSLKPAERKSLAEAIRPFIVRLRQREAVSLYAYDGAEKVHLVQEYPLDARTEPDEKDTSMDRLLSFSRRDASTSLYSAVIDGAQKLSLSLGAEGRPIQNGTLIVVALNPDSAGRVDESKVREFVNDSPHHYFLVTVGMAASRADLSAIAKNGTMRAGSPMTLSAPLSDVANAVDDDYFRNYLVSYCSPSRAGTRNVRLEVVTRNPKGEVSAGSFSTEFDANGFGPGCNPASAPHFVLAKPKEPKAVAMDTRSTTKPMNKPSDTRDKFSATNPEHKPSSAPAIAEPPRGRGYE